MELEFCTNKLGRSCSIYDLTLQQLFRYISQSFDSFLCFAKFTAQIKLDHNFTIGKLNHLDSLFHFSNPNWFCGLGWYIKQKKQLLCICKMIRARAQRASKWQERSIRLREASKNILRGGGVPQSRGHRPQSTDPPYFRYKGHIPPP